MRRLPAAAALALSLAAATPATLLAPTPATAAPAPSPVAATAVTDALARHEQTLATRRALAAQAAQDLERAHAALLASDRPGALRAEQRVVRLRRLWADAQQSADELLSVVRSERRRRSAVTAIDPKTQAAQAASAAAAAERLQIRLRRSVGPGGGEAAPEALRALDFALAQIGDPYLYAANGPDRWDCSGLTVGAYRSVGIGLPRVSRQQFWAGRFVPASQLLPGDLVFLAYVPSDPTTIHHVGMYAGDGLMVHAPRTGDVVRLGPVHLWDYAGAVRIVPAVTEPAPTSAPPTTAAPTTAPPSTTPPSKPATSRPPMTSAPPTTAPPTTAPPTTEAPTTTPTTTEPPTSEPPVPGEVSPAPATAPPDVTPSGAATPAQTP